MNYLNLIIIGIAGIVLGTYLGRLASAKATAKQRRKVEKEGKPFGEAQSREPLVEKQAREKEENKRKILEFFESRERVANDDIEALLGVSDATATRYLDELEKEGLIRQVGKTGKYVYYEKL